MKFNEPGGWLPWCTWFRGDLYWAVMCEGGPLRIYRSTGGTEPKALVFSDADATTNAYVRLQVGADGWLYAAYRIDAPDERIRLVVSANGQDWELNDLRPTAGNNPVAMDSKWVAQLLAGDGPFPVKFLSLTGTAEYDALPCAGTGIAYLTDYGYVSVDANRMSVPGMLNPSRCPGLTVGEQDATGPKCVLSDGRGGILWTNDGEWINPQCAVNADGRFAVTAWRNDGSNARVQVLTADEIAALPSGETFPPELPPLPIPPIEVPMILTAEFVESRPYAHVLGQGATPYERRLNALKFSNTVATDANAAEGRERYAILAGYGAESDVEGHKADIVCDRDTGLHYDVVIASEATTARPGFTNHGPVDPTRFRYPEPKWYIGSNPLPPVPQPPTPQPPMPPVPGEPTNAQILAAVQALQADFDRVFRG